MAKVSTDVSDISVVMKLSTDVSHKYLPTEALEQLKTRQIYNINLSKQGFQCIPSEIIEYTHVCNVRILNMADQSYPDDASLDEDHSPLKSIGNIRVFRGLQELYLGNNCLRELPEEISTLDQLLIVDLHWNQLTSFPEQLCVLSKLQVLKLSGNRIQQVTHHIKNMTGLKELRLSNNRIVELPSEIEYLLNIQILTLQRNGLRALPQSMHRLRSLKELKLADNSLLYPPQEMETKDTATILQYLQDHNNPKFRYSGQEGDIPPSDSIERVHIYSLCTPGELAFKDLVNHKCPMHEPVLIDASEVRINKLNSDLAHVDRLEYLDLSESSFTKIPMEELAKLPNLKGLSLEHQDDGSPKKCPKGDHYTPIMVINEDIYSLFKLVELNLSRNKILQIPQSIDCLKNLKVLDVTYNSITILPITLFSLVNLEYLGLSSNSIRDIPSEIQNLSKLQVLRLSHNMLQCLPESIYQLKKLLSLTLRYNKLKYLPLHFDEILPQFTSSPDVDPPAEYSATLLHYRYLPELRLEDNPDLKFPPEYTCKNISSLINFYKHWINDPHHLQELWKRAQESITKPNLSALRDDLPDTLLLSISEQVGDKWYSLGIRLGLDMATVDQIRIDFISSVSQQAMQMLSTWKSNTVVDGPRKLQEGLRDIGLSRVAHNLFPN